jgi:hypothetical protein
VPSPRPSGRNFDYSGPNPYCINICQDAFANTTGEFEWVAAGVLTELRAIITTLEVSEKRRLLSLPFF